MQEHGAQMMSGGPTNDHSLLKVCAPHQAVMKVSYLISMKHARGCWEHACLLYQHQARLTDHSLISKARHICHNASSQCTISRGQLQGLLAVGHGQHCLTSIRQLQMACVCILISYDVLHLAQT